MSTPIITVEDISKAYRIGLALNENSTFRDAIVDTFKAPFKRLRALQETGTEADTFWALRNVNFHVNKGEVVGLVGHNGAGKSTLLKVLSRITEPTEGRAVLNGRVASLLEVGTGFHPELSGRENIYLNGAILGMRKTEIDAKFDQIVEFAEISRFLDTPVKRYSSGMYVRLAFAVAAHLEPEILIVDEVLAVGDMTFQKKCIGKMKEVSSGGGRTVLFVSHNMDAIQNLCTHVILMKNGTASERMTVEEGVRRYLLEIDKESDLPVHAKPRGKWHPGPNCVHDLRVTTASGGSVAPTGSRVQFEMDLHNLPNADDLQAALVVTDNRGNRITLFQSLYHSNLGFGGAREATLTCDIPSLPLTPGTYYVDVILSNERMILEKVERAGRLEVTHVDLFGTGRIPNYNQGHVILPCNWTAKTSGRASVDLEASDVVAFVHI